MRVSLRTNIRRGYLGNTKGPIEGGHCKGGALESTGHGSPEGKVDEVFMVVEANAVAHPRTVVVHPQHTPFTQRAVMSPRGLYFIAAVAKFELHCAFLVGLVALAKFRGFDLLLFLSALDCPATPALREWRGG